MITKAQGDGAITLIGKEVEEVLIPTPGAMPGPVNKNDVLHVRVFAKHLLVLLELLPADVALMVLPQ